MANDLRLNVRITADGGQLKAEVGNVRGGLQALGDVATRESGRINTGFSAARRGVQSISEQLADTRRELIAFFSIRFAASQAGALIQLADEAKTLEARLRLASTSAQEYAQAQADVNAIADRTHAPLTATADLYGKMAVAMREMGRGQADAAASTEAVAQTLRLSGTSAGAAQGALLQFGQALASGVLRGDEFNSMMEAAPRLAQALAEGLNVPRGALRKLAEEGKLTADQVIGALLSQKDKLAAEYAQLPITVADSLTDVRNQFMRMVAGFDQATGTTRALSGALATLTENMGLVATAVAAVAAVMIGRGAGALAAYMAQTWAEVQATRAAVVADTARAASLRGIGMGAAAATPGVTMMGRAMALLGGPVGVIVTAVSALGLWALATRDAAKDTDSMAKSADGLADSMNRVTAVDAAARIVKLRDALARTTANPAGATRLREMIAANEQVIKAAAEQQARIQAELDKATSKKAPGAGDKTDPAAERAKQLASQLNSARDEMEKLSGALQQQVATLGQGDQAVLQYRLTLGDLSEQVKLMGPEGEQWRASILAQAQALKDLETQAWANSEAEKARQQLIEDGRQLAESVRTDYDVLTAAMERYRGLLAAGAIDQQTFNRAVEQAGEKFNGLSPQVEKTGDTINEFAVQAARNIQSTFADFLFQPFEDGLKGMLKKFGETLRRMVAELLAQKILMDMLGALAGMDNPIGAFIRPMYQSMSVGQKHTGGSVTGSGVMRQINPAAFFGAQRYHSGGMVGLRPGEVPIIAQTGETVIPRGGIAVPAPIIEINNYTGQPVRQEQSSVDGRQMVRLFIGEAAADVRRGGELGSAITQSFGLRRPGARVS